MNQKITTYKEVVLVIFSSFSIKQVFNYSFGFTELLNESLFSQNYNGKKLICIFKSQYSKEDESKLFQLCQRQGELIKILILSDYSSLKKSNNDLNIFSLFPDVQNLYLKNSTNDNQCFNNDNGCQINNMEQVLNTINNSQYNKNILLLQNNAQIIQQNNNKEQNNLQVEKLLNYFIQVQNLAYNLNLLKDIPKLMKLLIISQNNLFYEAIKYNNNEDHLNILDLRLNDLVLKQLQIVIEEIFNKLLKILQQNITQIQYCKNCKKLIMKITNKYNKRQYFYQQFTLKYTQEQWTFINDNGELKEIIATPTYCFHYSNYTKQQQIQITEEIQSLITFQINQVKQQFLSIHQQNINHEDEQKISDATYKPIQNYANQYYQKEQIKLTIEETEESKIYNVLLGQYGSGKTTIFKKLCDQNKMEKDTNGFCISKYKNDKYWIVDTPAFVLYKENGKEDKEVINTFIKFFEYKKIYLLFIVVKFQRIAKMKAQISDSLVVLDKFQEKIVILITGLDLSEDVDEDKEMIINMLKQFGILEYIFISQNDSSEQIIQEVDKVLQIIKPNSKILNFEDTLFDTKKATQIVEETKVQINQILKQCCKG